MSKRSIITDRPKSAVNKHWSARDRVKAVATFLVLGNISRVSEETGIPVGTLHFWKTQPWWFEQIEKIRQGEDQEIDNSFTKIVKRTQEIIIDRLENGDFYVNKDGQVARKPVGLRDASIAGAISMDKRQILRAVPTSEQNKVGMQERLKNLESEFRRLVNREEKTIEGTILETSSETDQSGSDPVYDENQVQAQGGVNG